MRVKWKLSITVVSLRIPCMEVLSIRIHSLRPIRMIFFFFSNAVVALYENQRSFDRNSHSLKLSSRQDVTYFAPNVYVLISPNYCTYAPQTQCMHAIRCAARLRAPHIRGHVTRAHLSTQSVRAYAQHRSTWTHTYTVDK